jgi:hypothetical protein
MCLIAVAFSRWLELDNARFSGATCDFQLGPIEVHWSTAVCHVYVNLDFLQRLDPSSFDVELDLGIQVCERGWVVPAGAGPSDHTQCNAEREQSMYVFHRISPGLFVGRPSVTA